jgi:hypothetical protein
MTLGPTVNFGVLHKIYDMSNRSHMAGGVYCLRFGVVGHITKWLAKDQGAELNWLSSPVEHTHGHSLK